MGLRRARHAHAPDGPAWNLSLGLSRRPSNRGCACWDWASRPAGMLSVKSPHVACERVNVPMFAGLPSSGLRTVRGVGRHAKARFRILKNQGSAS